jgi:hypothetical protein
MNKWQKTKVNPSSKLREVLTQVEQVKNALMTHQAELEVELVELQAKLRATEDDG